MATRRLIALKKGRQKAGVCSDAKRSAATFLLRKIQIRQRRAPCRPLRPVSGADGSRAYGLRFFDVRRQLSPASPVAWAPMQVRNRHDADRAFFYPIDHTVRKPVDEAAPRSSAERRVGLRKLCDSLQGCLDSEPIACAETRELVLVVRNRFVELCFCGLVKADIQG